MLNWVENDNTVTIVIFVYRDKLHCWEYGGKKHNFVNSKTNFPKCLITEEDKEWKIVPLPIEPFAELKHGGKVVCLCWNPHISGQLASSSYDKSVKVNKYYILYVVFLYSACVF